MHLLYMNQSSGCIWQPEGEWEVSTNAEQTKQGKVSSDNKGKHINLTGATEVLKCLERKKKYNHHIRREDGWLESALEDSLTVTP